MDAIRVSRSASRQSRMSQDFCFCRFQSSGKEGIKELKLESFHDETSVREPEPEDTSALAFLSQIRRTVGVDIPEYLIRQAATNERIETRKLRVLDEVSYSGTDL